MYICKDCFLDEELRSEINANAVSMAYVMYVEKKES